MMMTSSNENKEDLIIVNEAITSNITSTLKADDCAFQVCDSYANNQAWHLVKLAE